MKTFILAVFIVVMVILSSCNNNKVDKLEGQITELKAENAFLKLYIAKLQKENSNYKTTLKKQLSYQKAQQDQSEWHKRNAQSYMQEAQFWKESGNEFLYDSSMRNAQSELDMLH